MIYMIFYKVILIFLNQTILIFSRHFPGVASGKGDLCGSPTPTGSGCRNKLSNTIAISQILIFHKNGQEATPEAETKFFQYKKYLPEPFIHTRRPQIA